QKFPVRVIEGRAIIHVERSLTGTIGIHTQFQCPLRSLSSALDQRLTRNDRASANVDVQSVERWLHGEVAGLETLASPVVVPQIAIRQQHAEVLQELVILRRNQQIVSEHVLTIGDFCFRDQRLLFGILEKHWTHERNPVSGSLLHAGVNVRKQEVSLFYIALADGFVLWTMDPRLLIGASLLGVVAINRIEGAEF